MHRTTMNEVNSAVAAQPQHRTTMNEVNSAVAAQPQHRTTMNEVNSAVAAQPQHRTTMNEVNSAVAAQPQHRTTMNEVNSTVAAQPQHRTTMNEVNSILAAQPQHRTTMNEVNSAVAAQPQHRTTMNEVNSAVAAQPQHRTTMNEVNSAVAAQPQNRTTMNEVNSTVAAQPQHRTTMNEVNSAVAAQPQNRTTMNEVNSAVAAQSQHRTEGAPSFIINAVNSTVSVQPPSVSSSGWRDDFRFENIKASSKQHLETFDKRRFVETKAYHEARNRLKDLGVVVIVGPHGSGKTTMGAHLLKSLTRTPIILHSPEDWYTLPLRQSRRKRLNVLVDNIFGFDNLDYHRKEAWLQILEVMCSQVRLGLVSVVVLLSKDIFNHCQEQLKRFPLFQVSHIISLSDPKYRLNLEEKTQMFHIYNKTASPEEDQTDVLKQLSSLNSEVFPQICHTFASCKEAQKKGLQYFQNPVEGTVERFKILREQNYHQYFVLVLLAVMKGRLPESFFYPDTQSSEVKSTAVILKRVGHFFPLFDIDMNKLKLTTDSMVGEYLIYLKSDQSYRYLSYLHYDAILLTVAGCHVKDVIDICPSRFLVQYLPLCNPSERSLGVQVQKEVFKNLAERIAYELTIGDFFTILNHQALRDRWFVRVLAKVLGPEGCTRICKRKVGFFQVHKKAPFAMARYSNVSDAPLSYEVWEHTKRWVCNFKTLICLIIMHDLSLLAKEVVSQSKCCPDSRLLHCACFMGLNVLDKKHPRIWGEKSCFQLKEILTTCIVSDKVKVCLMRKLLTWWRKAIGEIGAMGVSREYIHSQITEWTRLALAVFKVEYVRELLRMLRDLPCDYARLLDEFLQQTLVQCYHVEERFTFLDKNKVHVQISEEQKLIQLLVDEGAQDQDGRMIFIASQHKSSDALELLLRTRSNLEYTLMEGDRSWTFSFASFWTTVRGTKGRTPLLEASCRSIESVKLLLAHGADVNAKDMSGYTILHSKYVYTDSKCLEMILSKISPSLGAPSSPLLIASEHGNIDCFLLLLEWYSRLTNVVDVLNAQDGDSTALMEAILSGIDKRDKVEALINAGADINLTNKNGNSALHLATRGNSLEIAEKLIRLGADVNQKNGDGDTPLHLALSVESSCVKMLLRKGADILLENNEGVTPLFKAGVFASVETLKLLLEYCPNNPLSTHDLKLNPLLASPNLDKVKLLTCSGFCLTPVIAQKFLIELAMDNFQVWNVLDKNKNQWQDEWYDKLVFHLCERGANVNLLEADQQSFHQNTADNRSSSNTSNYSDSDSPVGFTPLQNAMRNGHTKMVACLLRMGADPNVQSAQGDIIPFPAINPYIPFEIFKLLTECERNLNFGESAKQLLGYASTKRYWKTLDLLLRLGIAVNSIADYWPYKNGTALHFSCSSWRCLEVLLKHKVNVNLQNGDGNTALHLLATKRKSQGKICLLLRNGADPNIPNNKGETPLLVACSQSHVPQKPKNKRKEKVFIFEGLEKINQDQRKRMKQTVDVSKDRNETVKVLLENKANGDVRGSDGCAALHIAVKNSNYELVCILLRGGCDANVTDGTGNTPLNLVLKPVAECQLGTASYYIPHHRRDIQVWKFVKELLEKNADPDIQNKEGDAPLHHAASMNCQRSLELLLDADADVEVKDAHNMTPLHRCAQSGHTRIARILLVNSSDVNAMDDNGDTPLHMAVRRKQYNLVKLLVQMGADLSEVNTDGLTARDVCVKLEQSCTRSWWIYKGQKLLNVLSPVNDVASPLRDRNC